jgi:hypothetical protein
LNITDDKEDILFRINNSINTLGYPSNSSQLAFLLFFKKFINKEFELSKYEIKDKDSTRKVEGALAVSKKDFRLFDETLYIDDIYADIAILLKLSETTPSFKVGDFSCYIHPIVENSVLLCPDLKENLKLQEQIELLEFLITHHKYSSSLIYHKPWSTVFGFKPELYISSKFAIQHIESFPEHINNWYWNEKNDTQKQKGALLSSLGFNLPWALINTLREILVEPKSNRTFLISELNNLPIELVSNSFIYIKQNYPYFKFSQNFKYYDILKEMVKICIQHSQIKIPLPVSTFDLKEYNFKDPSNDTVYYYDINNYHELTKLNLDLDELIRATGCNIYNAAYWSESQDLKKQLQEIEINGEDDHFQVLKIREEWTEKFYIEWKNTNPGISLFYYDGLQIKLSLDGIKIKDIIKDRYYYDDHCIHCPKKFSFFEILKYLKTTNWISLNALNDLETLFNSHQMRVSELLNNPIMDSGELIY